MTLCERIVEHMEEVQRVARHALRSKSPVVHKFWLRWIEREQEPIVDEVLADYRRRGFRLFRAVNLDGEEYLLIRPPAGRTDIPEQRYKLAREDK